MASGDIAATIGDLRAKFTKYFETGDMKALSELYTEDCRLLTPGRPYRQGRAEVVKGMEAMTAKGIAKIARSSVEVSGSGDLAYECSENSYLKADGTVLDVKKTLAVFKKVGGSYLIHAVCYNSNNQ